MRPGMLDNNLIKRGGPERFIPVTLVANGHLNRAIEFCRERDSLLFLL
jgi:hypothetical protein